MRVATLPAHLWVQGLFTWNATGARRMCRPRQMWECTNHANVGSWRYGNGTSFGLVCPICRMGGGSWCTDSRIYACDLQRARHRRAWPGPTWPAFMIWAHAQCKVISGIVDFKNIAATRKNKFNLRTVTGFVASSTITMHYDQIVVEYPVGYLHIMFKDSQPWCHVAFGKVNAKCNPQVSAPPLFITDSLPSATLSAHNRHTSERYSPRGDMGKSSNCCIN